MRVQLAEMSWLVIVGIITVVVNWLYPISRERELGRWSMSTLVTGYFLAVVSFSAVVVGIAIISSRTLRNRSKMAIVVATSATFVTLLCYGITIVERLPHGIGIETIDIMNAKFLAEYQFVKFF